MAAKLLVLNISVINSYCYYTKICLYRLSAGGFNFV